MSGQSGTRGYLVQVLIAILDALKEGDTWITVTIEPDLDAEKVDIAWRYPDRTRAVQVKSSQNQITVPNVKSWAEALENAVQATEYELSLIGPISGGVSGLSKHGNVRIPTPHVLNLDALINQAAHKLDLYLDNRDLGRLRAVAREVVVNALAMRLSTFSTQGTPTSRGDFDGLLRNWIAAIVAQMSEASAPTDGIPYQLPPAPADFTGRENELKDVADRAARAGTRVIAIRGMGGVGKTALALKFAEAHRGEYPDGQLYLDLRGTSDKPLAASDVMLHVIRSLRPSMPPPARHDDYAGACRTSLHGRKLLIVFENASSADQFDAVLPAAGSLLVVTSRQQLAIDGMLDYPLAPLARNEAETLVLRVAARAGAAATEIAQLCGDLPLALRLSASALNARRDLTVEAYVDRLRDGRVRLQMVEASIEVSVQLLTPELRQQFLRLAVFPGTFDLLAACAIWRTDHNAGIDVMGQLFSYSLLDWNDITRRYVLHDFLRLFARHHTEQRDFSEIHTSLSLHYVSVARAAEEAYRRGGTEAFEGLAVFDQERENIELGFSYAAAAASSDDEAAQVCTDYVANSVCCRDLRHSPQERLAWLIAASTAAQRLKDTGTMVQHMGNAARAMLELGAADEAIRTHEKILYIARKVKDSGHEASALLHLGNALLVKEKVPEAILKYESALSVARAGGHKKLEPNIMCNLGAAYDHLGRQKEALEFFRPSIELFAKVGDPRGMSLALGSAGRLLIASSDPELGVEMLEHAVALAKDLKDWKTQKKLVPALVAAYQHVGRHADADPLVAALYKFAVESGDVTAQIGALRARAELARSSGDAAGARKAADEMLELARSANDHGGQCRALSLSAEFASQGGDPARSAQLLVAALKEAKESNERQLEVNTSFRLGLMYHQLGEKQLALEHLYPAVSYYQEMRHGVAAGLAKFVESVRNAAGEVAQPPPEVPEG